MNYWESILSATEVGIFSDHREVVELGRKPIEWDKEFKRNLNEIVFWADVPRLITQVGFFINGKFLGLESLTYPKSVIPGDRLYFKPGAIIITL